MIFGGGELILFAVLGVAIGAYWCVWWLFVTLGAAMASAIIVGYAACAAVTAGFAQRCAPVSDDGTREMYIIISTVLWPAFWVLFVVWWVLSALYRLGERG